MKIKPLVSLFQQTLPKYTDFFSDNFDVSSGNVASGLVTLVTSKNHNLQINQYITVYNAFISVDVTSFNVLNNIATIETSADHGLSMSMNYKTRTNVLTVDLSEFTDTSLNGTFTLLSVPNRNKFTISITVADGAYTADGKVINYATNVVNGVHQVTVINDTTFTYTISDTSITSDILGTPHIGSNFRITGANDIVRANAAYTKQGLDKYYLFITYGSSVTSKDRNILNDSTATFSQHSEFRLRLIEDFDVNIFAPVDQELTALDARDNIEDIKLAIFKTILRFEQLKQFSSDSKEQYVYINDFQVEANNSYLIHGYKFGTLYDVTIQDTAMYGDFAPFRDIDLSLAVGSETIENNINLDDEI